MSKKKEETASFVIRFRQMIFESDSGESEIQWRGNIRHVQGGDEKRFSEFSEVIDFVQGKLSDLTFQAVEDKSPEEQISIIDKSLEFWKKMAIDGPKMVLETIKDPKTHVAQLQQQIQEQIHDVGDSIGQKLDLDLFKKFTGQENKEIMEKLNSLETTISDLSKKVDKLNKKTK